MSKSFWCKYFSFGGENQLFHIAPPHTKTTPRNTRYYLVLGLPYRLVLQAEGYEVFYPRDLIPGRPIVFGKFSLDNYFRVELVRNNEIGGLLKSGNNFSALRFLEADASSGSERLLFLTLKDHLRAH